MINQPDLLREEKIGASILFVVLTLSLFINLGQYPFYLEEPRRALITLEMMYSGNWIVPTEFGEFYYKKPPVWNWVQMLAFNLFGVNEFAARFFGVVSFLMVGGTMYWACKRFINLRVGVYSSLLFLSTGSGIIYMNSAAGEIDLFYCAITFLMFLFIYHFYQKGNDLTLFMVAYLLTGLGALTKGVPSLVFVGMTLLGLFIEKGRFWKLFGYKHLSGLLFLVVIIGTYAFSYHQFNDFGLFFQTDDESLVEQSAGKSFLVSDLQSIIVHLFTFPFTVFFDLLPASLLILFAIKKELLARWWNQPFLRYLIITFLVNILIYWLSPLTRTRYIYMLYPVPIILMVVAFFDDQTLWKKKVLDALILIFLVIMGMGGLSLPFISSDQLAILDHLPIISLMVVLLVGALMMVYFKKPHLRLLVLVGGMVVLRLVFDFTAIPVRAMKSDMQNRKNEGQAIGTITHPEPVYIYKDSEVNHQRIFYIEQKTKNFVRLSDRLDTGKYYIVDEMYLKNLDKYTVHYVVEPDIRKGIRKSYLITLAED